MSWGGLTIDLSQYKNKNGYYHGFTTRLRVASRVCHYVSTCFLSKFEKNLLQFIYFLFF
jgi:hypothetical protein